MPRSSPSSMARGHFAQKGSTSCDSERTVRHFTKRVSTAAKDGQEKHCKLQGRFIAITGNYTQASSGLRLEKNETVQARKAHPEGCHMTLRIACEGPW